MKVPELKITELFLLTSALRCFHEKIRKDYMRANRMAKRRMFFRPWEKLVISVELLEMGRTCLQMLNEIEQLIDSLMESHGTDEDMLPVTFREILNRKLGAKK